MSDRWIEESQQLLRRLKVLSSKEKRDRLEVINSMLFTLNILERSLHGWKLWVRNLSLMSKFTLEELMDIERSLGRQIQPFIEYDIEVSRKWRDKFPRILVAPREIRKKEEGRGMYV